MRAELPDILKQHDYNVGPRVKDVDVGVDDKHADTGADNADNDDYYDNGVSNSVDETVFDEAQIRNEYGKFNMFKRFVED